MNSTRTSARLRNRDDEYPHPGVLDQHHTRRRTRRRLRSSALAFALGSTLLAACAYDSAASAPPGSAATSAPADGHDDHGGSDGVMSVADRSAAQLTTAGFQDVKTAEAAGYASSLDTLGCFQDETLGGMGVHYIDQSLMDATVSINEPEALVYELDADGEITGLVAHEYIVPVEAWTSTTPPSLFGVSFHRHPSLPLWVLHAWLWKENPSGIFDDWNPAVRQCPSGVPIFGVDLPLPADPPPTTSAGG